MGARRSCSQYLLNIQGQALTPWWELVLMKAAGGIHKAGDKCTGFQLLKYKSNKKI